VSGLSEKLSDDLAFIGLGAQEGQRAGEADRGWPRGAETDSIHFVLHSGFREAGKSGRLGPAEVEAADF